MVAEAGQHHNLEMDRLRIEMESKVSQGLALVGDLSAQARSFYVTSYVTSHNYDQQVESVKADLSMSNRALSESEQVREDHSRRVTDLQHVVANKSAIAEEVTIYF